MKIYVISMESDHQRRASLQELFPKHYPEFIFINAVDGRKFSAMEYFNLIKPNLYENNRLLSPAEVGCALSHMQALEKIVENNQPGIVFEDDVIGNDENLTIAKTLLTTIQDNEVIFLGGYDHIKEANKIFLKQVSNTKFANQIYAIDKNSNIYLGSSCCTAVGVSAAKQIIASQKKALRLADNWHQNTLNTNIRFKFTQLFNHPEQNTVDQKNSNIEKQRKSINYKKTHVLFWESILLKIRLKSMSLINSINSLLKIKPNIKLSNIIHLT